MTEEFGTRQGQEQEVSHIFIGVIDTKFEHRDETSENIVREG